MSTMVRTKSKYRQNMPNFVTSAPLFADLFKLKMLKISTRRKFARKNQSCTHIFFAFYRCKTERLPKSRDNGCLNLKNLELREASIFFLQPVTKYFAKSKEIKEYWRSPENFDICFFVRFHRY